MSDIHNFLHFFTIFLHNLWYNVNLLWLRAVCFSLLSSYMLEVSLSKYRSVGRKNKMDSRVHIKLAWNFWHNDTSYLCLAAYVLKLHWELCLILYSCNQRVYYLYKHHKAFTINGPTKTHKRQPNIFSLKLLFIQHRPQRRNVQTNIHTSYSINHTQTQSLIVIPGKNFCYKKIKINKFELIPHRLVFEKFALTMRFSTRACSTVFYRNYDFSR